MNIELDESEIYLLICAVKEWQDVMSDKDKQELTDRLDKLVCRLDEQYVLHIIQTLEKHHEEQDVDNTGACCGCGGCANGNSDD